MIANRCRGLCGRLQGRGRVEHRLLPVRFPRLGGDRGRPGHRGGRSLPDRRLPDRRRLSRAASASARARRSSPSTRPSRSSRPSISSPRVSTTWCASRSTSASCWPASTPSGVAPEPQGGRGLRRDPRVLQRPRPRSARRAAWRCRAANAASSNIWSRTAGGGSARPRSSTPSTASSTRTSRRTWSRAMSASCARSCAPGSATIRSNRSATSAIASSIRTQPCALLDARLGRGFERRAGAMRGLTLLGRDRAVLA